MSKISEEEIRTYAQMCSVDEAGYVAIEKAIQFGIDLHTSLPLSQRLTDEERDWIKKIHEDELKFAQFYQRKANSCCNQQCKIDYEVARDIAKSRAGLVEAIFGKELFGEG